MSKKNEFVYFDNTVTDDIDDVGFLTEEMEDFDSKLRNYLKDHQLFAYGCAKRWNGLSYGGYYITTVADFYSMSKDCKEFRIFQDGKGFHLWMYHHDGYVKVTMRELTVRGKAYLEKCSNNGVRVDFSKLFKAPYTKSLRLLKNKPETILF